MARVKIKRVLVPATVLLASLSAAFALYLSYENLELFTLRNKESASGVCSKYPKDHVAAFKVAVTDFLDAGSDSSIKSTLHSGRSLGMELDSISTCPAVSDISRNLNGIQLVLLDVVMLRTRQLDLMVQLAANSQVAASYIDSLSSLKADLIAHAGLDTASRTVMDSSSEFRVDIAKARMLPAKMDAMVSQLDSLKLVVRGHLDQWSDAESRLYDQMLEEEIRLRKAMVDHGMHVDQARHRMFLLTIGSWIFSLLLISGFYVASVFKRNNVPFEGAVLVPPVEPMSHRPSVSTVEPTVQITEPVVVDSPANTIDLSKVFFKCGGDVQLMKKMLNRYLTATFATAHNLKSYSSNRNMEAASRMLKTLIESSMDMGFDPISKSASSSLELIESRSADDVISHSLSRLSASLFTHIAQVKEQMGRHPAFK